MSQPNSRLKQLSPKPGHQSGAERSRQTPFLIAGILLMLVILACGGSADRVVMLERLPTLTRTPLPTLTPTPNATQVAMALATESPAADRSQNPAPAGAAPAESEMMVAGIAPGAAPIIPDAAPTGPEASTESAPAAPVDPAVTNPDVPAPAEAVPPTPTETPTPAPPTDTPTPVFTPTETPLPTSTPTETPVPLPEGWVFAGVRVSFDPEEEGVQLLGDVINNTGTAQKLAYITATFYDANGQRIPYGGTIDQSPIRAIPQGGRVPFELVAPGLQDVANFDLQVEAEPGGDVPRQDFEFLDVNPSPAESGYCVTGRLRNPGAQLASYLMIVAILYDSQDQVINYDNAYQSFPTEVVGDQTLDLDICVDPHQQEVARYDLRAWGL